MRILLVEDYLPLQKSVSQGIREKGWAIDVCGDGEEGLWMAQENEYDVIVLDIMLPKLNGLDVLTRLREGGDDTAVLLLTARDSVEDRMRGLDMGADDYLVKPFFLGELVSRINALVRRAYGQKDPVLHIDDLSVDTNSRLVTRGDEAIDLSAREYALLEYLARRKGQIVTRTAIWQHVYENYGGAGSNVVDVYIGYLRKKLHLPGMAPIIHTKRGQGYILSSEKARV